MIETRRQTEIEFGMRQNQIVRERRERWTDRYTQDKHPLRKTTRKGRWEQVRFQLCQIISYLSSWPHFRIRVINRRELENVPPTLCFFFRLRGRERKRDRPLVPVEIPAKSHPAPAWASLGLCPLPFGGWEIYSPGKGLGPGDILPIPLPLSSLPFFGTCLFFQLIFL